MHSSKLKQAGYLLGIGLGIVIVTAFAFSQIIFPVILGRTPKVEIPEVTGLTLLQAKRMLQDEKLHVVVKDSLFSESARVETVLEQNPIAGEKIRQDGTVYLIISKGSPNVVVPSIIGRPFQEVIVSLRSLGLHTLVADSTYSDIYTVNAVMRSIPSSGSKVNKGSTVRLILSRGSMQIIDTLSTSLPVYPY
ncbi:MAG: PASTA domain-containing protein [Candidatus Cloacimonetes bacterium]|nr:PASTA domain-containing protein [Candidatus Cloacimonadota bacterium]